MLKMMGSSSTRAHFYMFYARAPYYFSCNAYARCVRIILDINKQFNNQKGDYFYEQENY